jgi:hypothetical protein
MSIYYIHPSQSFFSITPNNNELHIGKQLIAKNGQIVSITSLSKICLDSIELKPNRSGNIHFPITSNLYVKSSGIKNYEYDQEVNVSYQEIIKSYICCKLKLFRTFIPFSTKEYTIPPYIIGVWLVKGNRTFIHCCNKYVSDRIQLECKKVETLTCVETKFKFEGITYNYRLSSFFYEWCKTHNCDKSMPKCPEIYLCGDKQQRTELLEGILDSIGHLKQQSNTFDITLRDKKLVDMIQILVTSLGFYICIKTKKNKSISQQQFIYRLYISVNPSEINCANPNKRYKRSPFPLHSLKTGFRVVSTVKKTTFYAVTFDKDPTYLFNKDGLAIGIKEN